MKERATAETPSRNPRKTDTNFKKNLTRHMQPGRHSAPAPATRRESSDRRKPLKTEEISRYCNAPYLWANESLAPRRAGPDFLFQGNRQVHGHRAVERGAGPGSRQDGGQRGDEKCGRQKSHRRPQDATQPFSMTRRTVAGSLPRFSSLRASPREMTQESSGPSTASSSPLPMVTSPAITT